MGSCALESLPQKAPNNCEDLYQYVIISSEGAKGNISIALDISAGYICYNRGGRFSLALKSWSISAMFLLKSPEINV